MTATTSGEKRVPKTALRKDNKLTENTEHRILRTYMCLPLLQVQSKHKQDFRLLEEKS